jgi:maltoporin
MEIKIVQIAILFIGCLIVNHAVHALEYNGYFRANTGSNSAGGGQVCFGLSGAGSKYRLGNECGVFGEFQISNELIRTDDGAIFKGSLMFDYTNDVAGETSLTYTPGRRDSDDNLGLAQLYIIAEDVPELGGATAWMGRRYYKREDFHITDFFYWNPSNNMGLGAGIEDYPIGENMKFSYALFRDDSRKTPPTLDPITHESNGESQTRHNILLSGLKPNEGGNLALGLSIIAEDSKVEDTHGGYLFMVRHRQSGVFGDGENKFAIQYATGAGVGSNGGAGNLGYDSDVEQFRILEGLYSQLNERLGGALVFVYDKISADDFSSDQVWSSFGGRVAYGLTPHIKLLADLGRDSVKPSDGGSKARLSKFTLSVALSAGPRYDSRPELRLFYTRASWNDAARTLATNADNASDPSGDPISAFGVFGNDTDGSVIGLSAEVWW